MNKITKTLQMDHLIMEALREDISSEDVLLQFYTIYEDYVYEQYQRK